jgi:hypothetical protein
MCNKTLKYRAMKAAMAALFAVALATTGTADQSPPGCNGNTSQIELFRSTIFVVNGGTVTYTVRVRNDSPGGCDVRNAQVTFNCPASNGTATGTLTTLVTSADFNIPTAPVDVGTVTCTINVNPGVTTATAAARLQGDLASLPDGFDFASAFKDITVIIRNPQICVTKQCVSNNDPNNPVINFNGTVTNCGNEPLVNVTVVDNKTGSVLGPISLAAGASAAYSGSYVPTHTTSTNIVTATGTGGDTGTPVSNTATASCSIVCSPSIQVSKECQNATSPTGPITFNGTVTNSGNVTLSGVTVVDDKAGAVLGPISLAPGASATYSGSYVPTQCPSTDTVTASGTANSFCSNTPVQAQASATCGRPVSPGISVSKVCQDSNTPDNPVINFNGTVTNTGGVQLNNVTVTDDKAGVVLGPINLAAGASAAYSGSYVATGSPTTDTVIASGTSAGVAECGGGSNVTAQASATCNVICNPAITVTKVCTDATALGEPITFNGTVCNTGNVTLNNVTVTSGAAGIVLGPISLAPGACSAYSGSYASTECGPSTDSVSASGTAATICNSQVVNAQATATCNVPCGSCITRTPGYWFTHHGLNNNDASCATLLKAIEANGGKLDLGFMCLPTGTDRNGDNIIDSKDTLLEALGFFYKKRTVTSDGKRASPLCQARKHMAFHLIAAYANVALLGTDPGNCSDPLGGSIPSNLLQQAREAGACSDVQAIRSITGILGKFNESGDSAGFPEGLSACSANPKQGRSVAVDVTTMMNCNTTANCAAGAACAD